MDASVAVKWTILSNDEPLRSEAHKLLRHLQAGEVSLLVPDLFWPEVGNVLWKAVTVGRMSADSALEALESLQSLSLIVLSTPPLMHDALAIGLGFRRSFYDSLYLALAVETKTSLITADEGLVNAVGSMLPVRWLGALL